MAASAVLRRAVSSPLFQSPGFAQYCVARGVAAVAQNALSMALVVLVVEQTGRSINSSLLILALVIPSTLAGIVSGAAADRFSKRVLMFLSYSARALLMLWLIEMGTEVAVLYLAGVLLATFTQFGSNAEAAMVPSLIERDDLTRANAINNAILGGAQLLGLAVLTPLFLRLFDPSVLFSVCLTLFTVAAAFALAIPPQRPRLRVPLPETPQIETETRWFLQGWRAMRDDPVVWHGALQLTLISAAMLVVATVVPKYIEDVLRLPIDVGILVLTPAAIGIAVGLRFAHWMAGRVGLSTMSAGGFILFVVMLLALAFAREEVRFLSGWGVLGWLADLKIRGFDGTGVVAMFLVAPLGFGFAVVNVAGRTMINSRVPLGLQGRVNATQAALAGVVGSLPVLAAGALADAINVRTVLALLAVSVLAVAFWSMRGVRGRRFRLSRVVEQRAFPN